MNSRKFYSRVSKQRYLLSRNNMSNRDGMSFPSGSADPSSDKFFGGSFVDRLNDFNKLLNDIHLHWTDSISLHTDTDVSVIKYSYNTRRREEISSDRSSYDDSARGRDDDDTHTALYTQQKTRWWRNEL